MKNAEPGDLDEVLSIEGAWPTTPHWTRRQFEAELSSPKSIFLVARLGDGRSATITGYGVLWILPPEAQLLNLAVAPNAARQGVGRSLFNGLLSAAKQRGCKKLMLEVSSMNEPALKLYTSLGCRVAGRRPKFYNDGTDAILMDLDIP